MKRIMEMLNVFKIVKKWWKKIFETYIAWHWKRHVMDMYSIWSWKISWESQIIFLKTIFFYSNFLAECIFQAFPEHYLFLYFYHSILPYINHISLWHYTILTSSFTSFNCLFLSSIFFHFSFLFILFFYPLDGFVQRGCISVWFIGIK